MNPAHVEIKQIAALLGGPVNSSVFDGLGVALASINRLEQRRGKPRAARELSHALESAHRSDGHDSRNDRRANSCEFAARTPIMKRVVVEEELRDDVVRTRVDFRFEMFDLQQRVRCFRVAFRKACNTDAKAATAVDAKALTFTFEKAHQIRRVRKVSRRQEARAGRWITAQRQDVAHTSNRVSLENDADVIFGVTKAREMRDGFDGGFAAQSRH